MASLLEQKYRNLNPPAFEMHTLGKQGHDIALDLVNGISDTECHPWTPEGTVVLSKHILSGGLGVREDGIPPTQAQNTALLIPSHDVRYFAPLSIPRAAFLYAVASLLNDFGTEVSRVRGMMPLTSALTDTVPTVTSSL